MAFSLRRPSRPSALPGAVREALHDRTPEKVLAWAVDDSTGDVVVAGIHRVFVVSPDGQVALDRPWHLIDGGSWDADDEALTVTWVEGSPITRWVFRDGATFVPETLRERVQASVVLAETLRLGGRRTARVVLRQDLATGSMLAQTLLGPGVRAADPGVRQLTQEAMARLKEQVGML
ncbi:MAG: hypothetical protein ABI131_03525 [Nostocoides sp.]